MLASAIITKFGSYVDDTSELSTSEEMALLNEKYLDVLSERPWSFLQAEASGVLSMSLPHVSLPANFKNLLPNGLGDDASAGPYVVFVGSEERQYRVINWTERRLYRDQDGYAYIDHANRRMCFTRQPGTAEAFDYDYLSRGDELEVGDEPIIPAEFQPIIYLDMAIDNDIIQRFEKARSYAEENRTKRTALMKKMQLWDAQFHIA